MPETLQPPTAVTTPTLFVEVGGRRIAYRSIGSGTPLVLCVRFRGVLDVWDPAFLDALATSFRVITFDYSGLGQSTGAADYTPRSLARDAIDLADALGVDRFVAGGWSLGGQAAQALTRMYPDRISHLILMGTAPPGKLNHGPEPVFFERALKFDNDLDDETVLFFEPRSPRSRQAAVESHDRIAKRVESRSPPIPRETYLRLLGPGGGDLFPDTDGYDEFLRGTNIPILVVSGDHEIIFPVHNWFDRVRVWRSLHLLVIPEAGHAPHHQEPQFCADAIRSFVQSVRRGTT